MDGIKFLETVNGSIFDVCIEFYQSYLKDEDDKDTSVQLVKHLIKQDIRSDYSNTIAVNESIDELKDRVRQNSKLVDQAVDNLIEKRVSEEEFYSQIWNFIFENALFQKDNDRISVLIGLVNNGKVPYFKLGDSIIEIGEEEYSQIAEQNIEMMKKAEFIMNLDYAAKSDTSSQILALINQADDEKVKTVILANAFGVLYDRISALVDIIRSISAEDEDEQE